MATISKQKQIVCQIILCNVQGPLLLSFKRKKVVFKSCMSIYNYLYQLPYLNVQTHACAWWRERERERKKKKIWSAWSQKGIKYVLEYMS